MRDDLPCPTWDSDCENLVLRDADEEKEKHGAHQKLLDEGILVPLDLRRATCRADAKFRYACNFSKSPRPLLTHLHVLRRGERAYYIGSPRQICDCRTPKRERRSAVSRFSLTCVSHTSARCLSKVPTHTIKESFPASFLTYY